MKQSDLWLLARCGSSRPSQVLRAGTAAFLLCAMGHGGVFAIDQAQVVGSGTPASCTEAALDAALLPDGLVTFDCGPDPVTIIGTGTKTITQDTTIDGGGLITISGGYSVRVFSVNSGVKFTVQNLTIALGWDNAARGGQGAAIYNEGTLTVTNSIFTGNAAGSAGQGGAIYNEGTLSVTNSTFEGNSAARGGAIDNNSGTLMVTNSTFNINSAGSPGGAIYNNGTLTVTNSSFTRNRAAVTGGAIENWGTLTLTNSSFAGNVADGPDGGAAGAIYNNGPLTVANSTFDGNRAAGNGGAIFNYSTLMVTNSTFARNVADRGGRGGAIYNRGPLTVFNSTFAGNVADSGWVIYNDTICGDAFASCPATLTNTIVANNTGNCNGTIIDGGHNLDDDGSCGFSSANGSLSNTNPQLDPSGLHSNGGLTKTIALRPGSPAIDAGDPVACAAAPVGRVDQRGLARPGTGSVRCSIGAYEFYQSVIGNGTPASCTEAELDAALAIGGLVTLNCGPDPVTITVTSEKLIRATTTIAGGGRVTLSGGRAVRIFRVEAGLDVRNLTIADGAARDPQDSSNGGGILNAGTLELTNCTLSGNAAQLGGGIYNSGNVTLTNCTLSGNSAQSGGGIYNLCANATLTNCTLSGNSAHGGYPGGGGVFDFDNFSACQLGNGGVLTLRNTIIANSPSGGDCVGYSPTDAGRNLIGDAENSCGLTDGVNGNLVGTAPLLDPAGLRDNGGPTQTMALLAGSPAIDAGDPEVCANPPVNGVDQRGYPRPGSASVSCSIGAYEYNSPGPPGSCAGDCDGRGTVTIDELLTGVNIALGNLAMSECSALDSRHDGKVTIDELVKAVHSALHGCGA